MLLFLLIDGNSGKSFGNFAFTRIWQGKAIVFTLLIPMIFFITSRFLNSKALFYFILIVMAGICGVGLSNAAVYLCPPLVICIALAHAINECIANKCIYTGRTIILILIAGAGTFYCIVFMLAILAGILPTPADVTAWTTLWPNNWLDNIRMVIGSNAEFLRDTCILFCLPWLNQKNAKKILCFSLLLILIFFNPITGPIWVKVVMPASYWRLIYLMPLPFCVGLIVLLLDFEGAKQGRVLKQTGIFMAIILLIVLTVQNTVLSPHWVGYKSPLEYQFARKDLSFSSAIVTQVSSKKILALEEIAVVLPFLDHNIKLETTRWGATYHVFSNAGLRTEGLRRLKAWEMVATGKRDAYIDDAMKQSISNGVDAIITRKEFLNTIMTFLSEQSSGWESSYKDENYALLVRSVSKK